MSHRKKDKSRERCLSKLGNCPPWYLSHSNLISPNKLHYCSVCSLLVTQWRIIPTLWFPPSPITAIIIHSTGETASTAVFCVSTSIRPWVRGSKSEAAPWMTRPTSFPLHFLLPPLFPVIPLLHCKEKKTEMLPVKQRSGGWTAPCWIFAFLNQCISQNVGSNYQDIKIKSKSNVNALLLYGGTLMIFYLLLLWLASLTDVSNNPTLQNRNVQTRPEESSPTCGVNKKSERKRFCTLEKL